MDKGLVATLAGTAAGAVVAALGYVAKQLLDFFAAKRDASRVRRGRLVKLYLLLRTSGEIFRVQNGLARELAEEIRLNHGRALPPELADAGFEQIFAHYQRDFTDRERDLHAIIRSQTVDGLRPINLELSAWLADSSSFQHLIAEHKRGQQHESLAKLLIELEVHLRLWHAKYASWIPDHPEHALVYLADESRHGVGFPRELDRLVAELAGVDKPA